MEAWGIIMTGFTLFGMLVLMVAGLSMDSGEVREGATTLPGDQAAEVSELKKAA